MEIMEMIWRTIIYFIVSSIFVGPIVIYFLIKRLKKLKDNIPEEVLEEIKKQNGKRKQRQETAGRKYRELEGGCKEPESGIRDEGSNGESDRHSDIQIPEAKVPRTDEPLFK